MDNKEGEMRVHISTKFQERRKAERRYVRHINENWVLIIFLIFAMFIIGLIVNK